MSLILIGWPGAEKAEEKTVESGVGEEVKTAQAGKFMFTWGVCLNTFFYSRVLLYNNNQTLFH